MQKGEVPGWFKSARKLALEEWGRTHNFERSAVYLCDPNAIRRIKDTLNTEVLPIVEKALHPRKLRILNGKPSIETLWQIRACCAMNIVIEDAARPYAAGDYPPWYSRLTVDCTSSGVGLIRDYLSITLPIKTNFNLVTDLLAETGNGLSTRLSVQETLSGKRELHIAFENGAGVFTGKGAHFTFAENIERKVLGHCDFIDIAGEIEHSLNDAILFRKLIRHVAELFE